MLSSKIKRCFSLFMAIFMLISLMPASVFAAGEEDHDHSHENIEQTADNTNESAGAELPAEDVPPAAVNPAIAEYQAEIDRILTEYFGGTQLTPEEIQATVDAMDDFTFSNWLYFDVLLLEENLMFACEDGILTEAEVAYIADSNPVFVTVVEIVYAKAAQMEFDAGLYTEQKLFDGALKITDSANNSSVSGNTYTAKAKGGILGGKTSNIVITNASGSAATVSFDYSVTSAASYNVDGNTSNASGSVSKMLPAGGTINITITSNGGFSNTTVTLTLSNITFTAAAASSNVTFSYNSSHGSVTVDGAAVANEDVKSITSSGAALVATPASGYTFLGWIDSNGLLLSKETSHTLIPEKDMTVRPIFVSANSNAWFSVGSYYFDNLPAAATFASSAANKTIVVASNGTLPSGNYTIPSGVTLQVPYDAANTLCTTKPTVAVTYDDWGITATAAARKNPTAYRTLKMATGAHITVNGALSVSGKASAYQRSNGCPTEAVGFIEMASGSSITVKNGAKLYAWGYITGSGSVLIESGGAVYEGFQLTDWRGGSVATSMVDNEQKVFPVSQYYIQNVEVPMTLQSGAVEYCYIGFVISKFYQEASVEVIGSNGMFRNTGDLVKDYNESKDRLDLTLNGNLTMSALNLEITGTKLNSANYILPVTNNITFTVKTGATLAVSQDMAMLPGSEIIVEEGANVELADGVNVYIYDSAEWTGKGFVYSKTDFTQLPYVGGKKAAPVKRSLTDAKLVINGTADASKGYVYTTAGGASITSDGSGVVKVKAGLTTQKTYQYIQADMGNGETGYKEIPITSAKLMNGDRTTFVETSGATEVTTYNYCTGHDGWYPGEKCNACNHTCKDYATHYAKADSTCIATGTIEYWSCSECGNKYSDEACTVEVSDDDLTIAIKSHSYTGDWSNTETQHGKLCVNGCNEAGDYENHSYENACDTTCNDGCGYTRTTTHTPGPAATCATAQICTVCNATITPATGNHSYTVEVEDTRIPATCIATGSVTMKCATCTATQVQTLEIDATNHTGNTTPIPAVTATCKVEGFTEGVKCADCDATLTAPVSQGYDENNHVNVVDVAEVPATCQEGGFTAGKQCTDCGVYTEGHIATKKDESNHTGGTENVEAVEATCKVEGSTAGVKCLGCGKVISGCDNLGLDENNHMNTTTTTVDPTCIAVGSTTVTCDDCGKTISETQTPALGHTPAAAVEENRVESTCTVAGSYDSVVYCSVCNTELSREPKVLELAAHTPGEAVVESAVAATCTAEGSYDNVVYCTVCNEELSRDTVTTDKIAHAYDAVVTAPTCTAKGYTTYTCTACGDSYVADETEMVAHTPAAAVEEDRVESTCTVAGSYDSVVYCSACNAELSRETKALELAAHTPGEAVVENEVPATCGVDGSYDSVVYCSVCKTHEISRENKIIKAEGHKYVDGECGVCHTVCAHETYEDGKCVECGKEKPVELFSFAAANIKMGNSLDMMFAFPQNAVSDWNGYYVRIEREFSKDKSGVIAKTEIIDVPCEQWTTSGSYYVVTYTGLAAKEMCDKITLVVYNPDGIAVSHPWVDSMKDYAMRRFNQVSSAVDKSLFVEMLRYGAAAQQNFGYGTDNLATSEFTAVHEAYFSEAKPFEAKLVQGDKWAGSNIKLESNISFWIAFKGLTRDMYAVVEYDNHYGNHQNYTIVGNDFGKSGSMYYLDINKLVIADARQVISVTIYNADGSVYTTCQESIEDYLARRSSVSDLFGAIMRYADAAYAYFHK